MTESFDDKKHKLIVAQAGGLRVIGHVDIQKTFPDPVASINAGPHPMFIMHDVGAIITQRATVPGRIANTIEWLKHVSITNIDYASGPVKCLSIQPNLVYEITDECIGEKDKQSITQKYLNYLEGHSTAEETRETI
jgi:hypothetical protein